MRQRGQRFEMTPKPPGLLKAHRRRGLIPRPRQVTENRTAAPAEKSNRATNPLCIAVAVDTHVAWRGAVAHLPVDAWRDFLARRELAAAGAQPEDSRQRPNRMLDTAAPDE